MSYSPKFTGDLAEGDISSVGGITSNNSGVTINRALPIRVDGNGDIQLIDVSVEAEALAVAGVTKNSIDDGTQGTIVSSGRVTNITTTANNGDVLFVSKTGSLTNVKPEIGVGGFLSGDFVIRIGVLFKNDLSPIQQDLLLSITVIGQL